MNNNKNQKDSHRHCGLDPQSPHFQQSQERYQNLVTDYSFKFVFTREQFLLPFLNEILQGQEKIKSIEYINPHRLGKNAKDRSVIFDVYCKNNNGELILLEMQNFNQKYFIDRSIYYSSHLIQQQGIKGEWDYQLKPMYIIGILNFTDKKGSTNNSVVRRAQILYTDNMEVFSDKLNFILVYLPKFSKTADELETPLDYWLHAFTHSQPNKQISENILRRNKLFAELLDTIELNKLNKSEMKKYQASKITFESTRPYMTGHYEDGKEDGLQQGLHITAMNALKKGLSLKTISDITSLSISEIENLKKIQ